MSKSLTRPRSRKASRQRWPEYRYTIPIGITNIESVGNELPRKAGKSAGDPLPPIRDDDRVWLGPNAEPLGSRR